MGITRACHARKPGSMSRILRQFVGRLTGQGRRNRLESGLLGKPGGFRLLSLPPIYAVEAQWTSRRLRSVRVGVRVSCAAPFYAKVAQLNRAIASEVIGCGFNSHPLHQFLWVVSSIGRALRWQCKGLGFEFPTIHQFRCVVQRETSHGL